jgi:hypothetical protein
MSSETDNLSSSEGRERMSESSTGHLPSAPPDSENSRDSFVGAGWGGTPEELWALLPPALQVEPAFSWLRLKVLTGGRRNDPLAKLLGDPSHERRQAWLNQMYGDGVPDLTIDRTDLDAVSFLLLGDTGEGDISQYAAMSVIDAVAAGADFMVICSDVIYPAGGTLEYAYKFCWPDMRDDLDPTQYTEADRREVDPPIEVESATWSPGGQLDWWVKERREWWGRVRGSRRSSKVDQSCGSSSCRERLTRGFGASGEAAAFMW